MVWICFLLWLPLSAAAVAALRAYEDVKTLNGAHYPKRSLHRHARP